MPRSEPFPIDDAALLQRVAARDAAALSALYDRHAPRAYGIALRVLDSPEDAQETVLDVFCHIWRSAEAYDARRGAADGWIMMIARSRARDRLRARMRAERRQTDLAAAMAAEPGARAHDPEAALLTAEHHGRMREALASLTPAQRRVLELAYFDGLTQVAIAQRHGETLGTIKSRARAGLLRLRAAMGTEASAPVKPASRQEK
jgi:RNA polymerase sigma-70 factor (ECF subfamily)